MVVTCKPHANDVAKFFEKINNLKRDIMKINQTENNIVVYLDPFVLLGCSYATNYRLSIHILDVKFGGKGWWVGGKYIR